MKRFEGQVALVTGASAGIGLAIARRLHQEGATVFAAQRRPVDGLQFIEADLLDEKCPGLIAETIEQQAGRLDILVNNAGIMRESTVANQSPEDWSQTLAVNLTAPFLLVQATLPLLKRNRGRIINIGSIEGLAANPLHSAYCASKAGLHGLTRALAVDLGEDGIRCNAVAPGWINTDLNEEFINKQENPDAFRRDIGGIHPIGRTGTPEEVASLVAFLASEDSEFITGQVFTADGGRTSQLSLP